MYSVAYVVLVDGDVDGSFLLDCTDRHYNDCLGNLINPKDTLILQVQINNFNYKSIGNN